MVRAAQANLAGWPWATVHEGNGSSALPSDIDVILVHAGSTHILDTWLGALTDSGRLLVPLTVSMHGFSATLSKGMVLVITRDKQDWSAQFTSPVVIYSLQGIRDETKAEALTRAMMSGTFMKVRRLRRDKHEMTSTCWLHGDTICISE